MFIPVSFLDLLTQLFYLRQKHYLTACKLTVEPTSLCTLTLKIPDHHSVVDFSTCHSNLHPNTLILLGESCYTLTEVIPKALKTVELFGLYSILPAQLVDCGIQLQAISLHIWQSQSASRFSITLESPNLLPALASNSLVFVHRVSYQF